MLLPIWVKIDKYIIISYIAAYKWNIWYLKYFIIIFMIYKTNHSVRNQMTRYPTCAFFYRPHSPLVLDPNYSMPKPFFLYSSFQLLHPALPLLYFVPSWCILESPFQNVLLRVQDINALSPLMSCIVFTSNNCYICHVEFGQT